MNELACQYSIVRFLPYAETGEFANVGVILVCPGAGFIGAEIMPTQRTKRITDFFDALDARIYREALKYLKTELLQKKNFIDQFQTTKHQEALVAFTELTRPREALLRFGPTRTILAQDPQSTLKKLFAHFVERDFANKEYHEEILNRGVATILSKAALKSYFEIATVGDDTVSVRFPFVSLFEGHPALAIKPLHLAREESSRIIDYGGHWVDRINRLKKHQLLPDGVLFAVNKPTEGKALRAAQEIIVDLTELGVQITDVQDQEAIVQFANQAIIN